MMLRTSAAALACLSLAACFGSEDSLIGEGGTVLPVDGSFVMCIDENGDCPTFEASGDGYAIKDREGDLQDLALRFAPLSISGGRQVFVIEAHEPEGGYIYGLAQRLSEPGPNGETVRLAAVECDKLPGDVLDAFVSAGGVRDTGIVTTCMPTDFDMLKATLIAGFGDDFSNEDWWAANGPR